MDTPYLSIIVPVYNVEKYIEKCLNSILSQNYLNFEVILINDGSTDNSGKICDEFALNSKLVKVVHQENKGLSGARNAGISLAKGEYIWFIDSDDWIVENAFTIVVEELKKDKVEMLGFYEIRFFEEKNRIEQYDFLKKIPLTNANLYLKANKRFVPAVWSYIYSFSFIKDNNFLFEEKMFHEDDYFNLICFSKVEKIKRIDKALYFYRIRQNSILTSEISTQRLDSYVKLIKLSKSLLKSDLDIVFLNGLIRSYITILFVYLDKFKDNKEVLKSIIFEVKKIVPKQNLHFKDKKGVLLEKIIYNLSANLYLKYKSNN